MASKRDAEKGAVELLEEAVRLANGTSFGLGANAWTQDPAEQERFITDLEAGAVWPALTELLATHRAWERFPVAVG